MVGYTTFTCQHFVAIYVPVMGLLLSVMRGYASNDIYVEGASTPFHGFPADPELRDCNV